VVVDVEIRNRHLRLAGREKALTHNLSSPPGGVLLGTWMA
jgi:hypothetical protein